MYEIVSENELYHWDKGGQASKHKYIDRKMKNGRWVYIYPGDQYKKAKREAYLAKGRSEAERSGYGAMTETRLKQQKKTKENYKNLEKIQDKKTTNMMSTDRNVEKLEKSVAAKIERGQRKLKKYLNRGVKTKIKEPKTSNKTEKVNLSELEKQGYKKNTEKGNSQKKRKKGLRLPNGTYIRFRTKK